MQKKILITGANGFLGSSIVKQALKKKFKVRALVRQNSDITNIEKLNVEIVKGDLRKKDSLKNIVKGCEFFFHVAADYRLWAPKPSELYETNVMGTQNLLDHIKSIKNHKLAYTSSVATLGISNDKKNISDEKTPVSFGDMIGDYKKSKYLAEKLVIDYVRKGLINSVILNPSTPIGAGDIKPTPTGEIILQLLRKKMPGYVDTGLNFVAVEDVALGHFQALESGTNGEKYILGGENMLLKDFLEKVSYYGKVPKPTIKFSTKPLYPIAYLNQFFASFLKYKPILTIDGLKMSEKKMFFSSEKAKNHIGYRPSGINNAIKDSVDWMKKKIF